METLAVKYRPKTFEDICSQEVIIKILQRQLEFKTFKNAYLFCGSSGCGKTTVARIFALEINKYLDSSNNVCSAEPIEIDGASNNGVDNVKAIISAASERSLDGKYKVYIIDECHALTNQAWQAFLKCIEEPPAYTIFIFCTTDPQKIPATILNRVMRFNFTRIPIDKIRARLEAICIQEQYSNYNEACDYIARISAGGMRDAIALLEKAASYNSDLTISNVVNAVGNYSNELMFKLLNALIDGDEATTILVCEDFYISGNDLKLFLNQLLDFCLNVNKYAIFKDINMTKFSLIEQQALENVVNFENASSYYLYVTNKLMELKNNLKYDTDIKSSIEISLLNIARCQ